MSWSRDEYAALGVPFGERGKILDEQLEILSKAWGPFPFSHSGEHFCFEDVWLEPGAHSPDGPPIWLGGQGMHPPLVRRLVRYGKGLNPFGALSDDDLELLATGMREAGRDLSELELVGGIRGRFEGPDDVADLDEALESLPAQLGRGFTTISSSPPCSRPTCRSYPRCTTNCRTRSRGSRSERRCGDERGVRDDIDHPGGRHRRHRRSRPRSCTSRSAGRLRGDDRVA